MSDEALAEAAEAVRAYLVSIRGGAPLLSGADARLLHDWLTSGVRVGVIARSLDRVAQRRLAQKVRAPLSLASCRAEVEKAQRSGAAARPRRAGTGKRGAAPAPPVETGRPGAADSAPSSAAPPPGGGEGDEFEQQAPSGAAGDFAAADAIARAAAAAIAGLTGPDGERRATAACAIAAAFAEEAWALAPRESLLAEAEASLADSRDLYDDAEWAGALECVARDRLRKRYPSLTATWIWQEFALGME